MVSVATRSPRHCYRYLNISLLFRPVFFGPAFVLVFFFSQFFLTPKLGVITREQNELPLVDLLSQPITSVLPADHGVSQSTDIVLDCSIFENEGAQHIFHIVSTAEKPFDMSTHDPEKEVISMNIKKKECFECDILRSLLSALKKSPDASLIDIGGNIGMYSLHAASYGRKVVAFEPFMLNNEKFCQSILLNSGFEDRIKLVACALTNDDTKKYVDFNKDMFKKAVYKRNQGQVNFGSMQVNGHENKPSGDLGKDYARAITMDSLQDSDILPEPGSHVVLKVDVEGSECRALAGAFDYLNKVQIDYVALEWTSDRMKQCSEDGIIHKIFDLFAKNGLKAHKYDVNGWIKIDLVTNPEPWSAPWANGMFDLAFSKATPSIV